MEIKKAFVAGAGTMGRGIAQTIAEAGIEVMIADVSRDVAVKAIATISEGMQRRVARGEMKEEDKKAVLARITPARGFEDAAGADIVIEAVVEEMGRKREVFDALDRICSASAVLATNTSALSVSGIADATRRPERVVGMHFFNPVPRMKLVEIVKGKRTAPETVAAVKAFAEKLGKTPVEVKESPGFIVNRLLIPMINEAVCLLAEGTADPEAIDTAMKLGTGHPMGPLALADLIGLDVCLFIMETFERECKNSKYAPCPLLKQMVREGKLGRKTGRGFFTY